MLIGQVGEPETGYPMAHNGPHIETVVMCDPATPSPIVRRGYRQKIKRRGGWLANDSAILSYGCTSPTTKSWVEMRVVLVEPAFFSKIELRRDGCHHKHAVVGRRTVRPRPAVDPGPGLRGRMEIIGTKVVLGRPRMHGQCSFADPSRGRGIGSVCSVVFPRGRDAAGVAWAIPFPLPNVFGSKLGGLVTPVTAKKKKKRHNHSVQHPAAPCLE